MVEVRQGDGNAFTVLFDRYNRLVLTVALRIVHDAAEAQEVTQDVFFEFYRSARRFDPARGTLKVWLLQFAYHRSINRRNYLLLRQFYSRPDLEEAMVWEASAKTTPRIPAQELKQVVEELLTTLSEAQRSVVLYNLSGARESFITCGGCSSDSFTSYWLLHRGLSRRQMAGICCRRLRKR
jgi:RNA polymerase sigma-70 factor (ECF subfamily)